MEEHTFGIKLWEIGKIYQFNFSSIRVSPGYSSLSHPMAILKLAMLPDIDPDNKAMRGWYDNVLPALCEEKSINDMYRHVPHHRFHPGDCFMLLGHEILTIPHREIMVEYIRVLTEDKDCLVSSGFFDETGTRIERYHG